jgi:hypothetical protein
MRILVDGETFAIFGHVLDLDTITGLAQDGIKRRAVDGGASKHAIDTTNALMVGRDHGLTGMSHVRHEIATLPSDQPESLLESRSRVTSVRKAAAEVDRDPRTIYRWIEIEPELLVSEEPTYRVDLDAIKARADRAKHRSAAA